MAENEPTAGTPTDPTDGAATGSGTPAAPTDGSGAASVDADELTKLRNIRDQFLREKDNTERIRQENDSLRQQVEQASRASMPPTGYDPAAQQAARLAQTLQNVQERDPEVAELLSATARLTHEQLQRQQAEQRFYRELSAVPAEDQQEVDRIARAENIWPSMARDRLLARRYEKDRTELAEQRRKLQEREDALKRGVVKTTAEPAPPKSDTGSPTREEYIRTQQAAGKGDRNALAKVREWDAFEETNGPMKLRDG